MSLTTKQALDLIKNKGSLYEVELQKLIPSERIESISELYYILKPLLISNKITLGVDRDGHRFLSINNRQLA